MESVNSNSNNDNNLTSNRPTIDMSLFTGVTIFDQYDDPTINNDDKAGNEPSQSEKMKIWFSEYYLSVIGYRQQREKRLNEFYADLENPNSSPTTKEEKKNMEYEHFQKETSYLRIKRKTVQKEFEPLFLYGDHLKNKNSGTPNNKKQVRRSGTFSPTSMQLAQSPELKNVPIQTPVRKVHRYSISGTPVITTTTSSSTTYQDQLSPFSSPSNSHENLGNTVLFSKPPLEDPELIQKSRPLSTTLESLERRRTKSVSSIKKDSYNSNNNNNNGLTMDLLNFTPVKSTPIKNKSRTMMFKFDTKLILEETEKLLQEKEEDTRIAAEIGQSLLEKNDEMEKEMKLLTVKLQEHENFCKELSQENEKLKTENILLSSNIDTARIENESLINIENMLSNKLTQQNLWMRAEHSPMKNKTIQQQKEEIEELKSTVETLQESQGKLIKNRDKLKNANELLQSSMLDLKDQLHDKVDVTEVSKLKNKISNLRSKNRQLSLQIEQNLNDSSGTLAMVKDPEQFLKTAFNELVSNEEVLSSTPRITSLRVLSDAKSLLSRLESDISKHQDVSLISSLLKYLEQESTNPIIPNYNNNSEIISNLNESFESTDSKLSDPKSALYILICVVTIQKYTKYDQFRIKEIVESEVDKDKALKFQIENKSLKKSLEELEGSVDEYRLKNEKLLEEISTLKESQQSYAMEDELSYFNNNNSNNNNFEDIEKLKKDYEDQLSKYSNLQLTNELEIESKRLQIENLETEIMDLINQFKVKEENNSNIAQELIDRIKELEINIESLTVALKNNEKDFENIKVQLESDIQLLNSTIQEKLKLIETKDLAIQELEKLSNDKDHQYNLLNDLYGERDKQYQDVTLLVQDKVKEIRELNSLIIEKNQEIITISEKFTSQVSDLDKLVSEKDQIISKLNQTLSSKDQEISDLIQTISSRDNEIVQLQLTITEKSNEILKLSNTIQEISQESQKVVQEKENEIHNLKNSLTEIEAQFNQLKKEKELLLNSSGISNGEIESLNTIIIEKSKEITKLEKQIQEKDQELQEVKDKFSLSTSEISNLKQEISNLNDNNNNNQVEINNLKQLNNEKSQEILGLQEINNNFKQILKEKDDTIENSKLEISSLSKELEKLKAQLISVTQSHNNEINELKEKSELEISKFRDSIEKLHQSTLSLFEESIIEKLNEFSDNRLMVTQSNRDFIHQLSKENQSLRLEIEKLLSEIQDLKSFIEVQSNENNTELKEENATLIVELHAMKEEFELAKTEKVQLGEKLNQLESRSQRVRLKKRELSLKLADIVAQVNEKSRQEKLQIELDRIEEERLLEMNKISKPNFQSKDYYIEMEKPLIEFINQNIKPDSDITDTFPIQYERHILYSFYDGVLLCKLVNFTRPETIDERVMNLQPTSKIEVEQNLNLIINSAKAIGCVLSQDINPLSLLTENPIELLTLIYELIKVYLCTNINVSEFPSLMVLKTHKEHTKHFIAQSPTQLLTRWIQFHFDIKKSKQPIEELVLVPSNCIKLLCKLDNEFIVQNNENEELSIIFDQILPRFNIYPWLSKESFQNKNLKLTNLFITSLFKSIKGIGIKVEESNTADQEELKKVVELSFKDIEGTREERAFCIWLNSLNITPYVNNLQQDLQDGLVILQMFDKINPGCFNFTKDGGVNLHPSNAYQELENCNIGIRIAKQMGFSLVGIDGKNIHECNRKLTLSIIWQACKHHYLSILQSLRTQFLGSDSNKKEFSEIDITNWANNKVKSIGKSTVILGFRDPTISTGKFLLDLLEAVQPGTVNYKLVQDGNTSEEKKSNAQYIINSARKLGCYIFVIDDDIIEVKQKMIMTLVASLMAKDLKK